MSGPILFLGTYRIPEDKLEDFKKADRETTEIVEANETGMIPMHTYTNEDDTEGSTMHIHPDPESLEFHMQVARERIGTGMELVETQRIELYGKPSDRLMEKLQDVSVSWPVIVRTHLQGFTRYQAD